MKNLQIQKNFLRKKKCHSQIPYSSMICCQLQNMGKLNNRPKYMFILGGRNFVK